LKKMLEDRKLKLDLALNIELDDEDVMKRISGRRTCSGCGQPYNVFFSKPKREGLCDKCGKELSQRADDKGETVKQRLKVYREQTKPLLDYYEKEMVLKTVDGSLKIEEVLGSVVKILKDLKA
jgi:adenylate kinase